MILAVLIASIAVAHPLELVAGPGGVARALSNTANDQISDKLIVASVIALGEAGVFAWAARVQARWRG